MTEPTPQRGTLLWVHYHAVRDRAKFWVGSVVLSALVVVVGTQVTLPLHPTTSQRVVNGLVALAIAVGAVVVGTYLYALVAAPYQQRRALRDLLTAAQARIAELEAEPVGPRHAEQLRQLAVRVKRSLEMGEIPAFRTPGGDDYALWRGAFSDHFPELRSLLEAIEDWDRKNLLLRERVIHEARAMGMDVPPWLLDEFAPVVTDVIHRRAMTDMLEGPFNFDWAMHGQAASLGRPPDTGVRIVALGNLPEFPPNFTNVFEGFFKAVERSQEARDIRPAWDARSAAVDEMKRKLDIIQNTEIFTEVISAIFS